MSGSSGNRPPSPEELPAFDADPAVAPIAPHELFGQWLDDAAEHGPAAGTVVLSTVDAEGAPDARVLVLKGADAAGFSVSTSADSPTGEQLRVNPHAALTFHWPGRGRQVRVRGPVSRCAPEVSAGDFLDRSPGSRVESAIGHQSQVLHDPAELTAAAEQTRAHLDAEPDFVPDGWTRYLLEPLTVEFWQNGPDRRHLRLRYRRTGPTDPAWTVERLWP